MAQHFSQPFPKPDRDVFTLLCTLCAPAAIEHGKYTEGDILVIHFMSYEYRVTIQD